MTLLAGFTNCGGMGTAGGEESECGGVSVEGGVVLPLRLVKVVGGALLLPDVFGPRIADGGVVGEGAPERYAWSRRD